MRTPYRILPLISLFALAALLMPATPSSAASDAVILVDTTADELANDGDCSLREAIYAANNDSNLYGCTAGSGTDTIILPAGFYQLSLVGVDENNGLTGDLDILGSLFIQGAGRDSSVVDGNDTDRVFHIMAGASVEISHLTIQNGNVATGFLGGGGILNQGTLTLQDVSVQNNRAENVGGGMDNYGGTAKITNSSISGNISTKDGGGIFNGGTLTLISSIISENMAANGGGGLDNGYDAWLENVSISGNTSAKDGGGIFNDRNLDLYSSTLSGNTATTGGGGGLDNWGSTTMENVTISGNTASEGGGLFNLDELLVGYTTIVANIATAALGDKGGNLQNAGSIRMKTSIVADSLAGPNCHGSGILSEGHNLDDEDTCNFHGVGDLINQTDHGIDPLLTDNGGLTLTHTLLQGSPAIDGGDDQYCPERDQRGAYRPADGDGYGEAICDIGAYEYEGVFPTLIFVPIITR